MPGHHRWRGEQNFGRTAALIPAPWMRERPGHQRTQARLGTEDAAIGVSHSAPPAGRPAASRLTIQQRTTPPAGATPEQGGAARQRCRAGRGEGSNGPGAAPLRSGASGWPARYKHRTGGAATGQWRSPTNQAERDAMQGISTASAPSSHHQPARCFRGHSRCRWPRRLRGTAARNFSAAGGSKVRVQVPAAEVEVRRAR